MIYFLGVITIPVDGNGEVVEHKIRGGGIA